MSELKQLTAEDFRLRREKKRTVVPVELPELGGVVYVRSMSAGEYNWYQSRLGEFLDKKKNGQMPDNQSPNQTALLLQLTVCDASGRLLFKIDDNWLTELERNDIEVLEDAAGKLNKIPGFGGKPYQGSYWTPERLESYRIALAFGRTDVDEFLDELSAEEYRRWCQYYQREPWGSGPLEDLLSQLVALTHNLHIKPPLAPDVFSPWGQGRKLDKKPDLAAQARARKQRFMRGRGKKKP